MSFGMTRQYSPFPMISHTNIESLFVLSHIFSLFYLCALYPCPVAEKILYIKQGIYVWNKCVKRLKKSFLNSLISKFQANFKHRLNTISDSTHTLLSLIWNYTFYSGWVWLTLDLRLILWTMFKIIIYLGISLCFPVTTIPLHKINPYPLRITSLADNKVLIFYHDNIYYINW